MTVIIGTIGLIRYYEGTGNPMMWMAAQDIPEWCALEFGAQYVVEVNHQATCRIIDLSIFVNFLGGEIDGSLETLDFQGRFATKGTYRAKDPISVHHHYRTEHYPMNFSPAISTQLVYQEKGITKKVSHSLELGPAAANSIGTVDGLMIQEYRNVDEN